jgi:predicted DNA-binding transcriptional regulator AlpA
MYRLDPGVLSMIERHLTPRELAELSGLREGTLAAWRARKTPGSPPYVKFGRLVRYRESDVAAWLSQRQAASAQPVASK